MGLPRNEQGVMNCSPHQGVVFSVSHAHIQINSGGKVVHMLKYGEVIRLYTQFNLKFRWKMNVKVLVTQLCPTLCDAMDSSLPRSLSLGFSSKNTGLACHFLLQRIFPTQQSNSGLPHCRQILYHLSRQGSPINYFILEDSSFIVYFHVSLYL